MSVRNRLLGTSVGHVLAAQSAILKHFVRQPLKPVSTLLPTSGYVINSVDSGVPSKREFGAVRTLVLAHGLGSGLAFFFHQYDSLLRANGGSFDRVIGLDWLGFGASSRPNCRAPRNRWWSKGGFSLCRSRFETEASGDTATAFFVDSLEEWRAQLGLDSFTLVGHSLGGYLSARYAMAHPARIDGLVLASPAGLTVPPTETDTKNPKKRLPESSSAVPWQLRLLDTAWSANITPGQLFRAWSYMRRGGPQAVEAILRRRFGDRWPAHENALIAHYLYHITAQPGSGEFAMNSLLVPIFAPAAGAAGRGGVFARQPIQPRVHLLPMDAPVLVLFGDADWLRPPADGAEAFVEAARHAGCSAYLRTIPNAGHHLYLDNSSVFNGLVNQLHSD